MRYSNAGKLKENGVVYTPTEMANYLAFEIYKYWKADKTDNICILDPAVGQGELLVAMIQLLIANGIEKITAVGYETDDRVALDTKKKLASLFPDVKIEIRVGDFLKAVESNTAGKYDFVIANPPYIRTQILGSDRAQQISEKLSLSGRIDIYYAFLIYTKNVLKSNGVAGYITSNKFLTIKSGNAVRNYMLQNYQLHRITDLGDTKLFSASVLPCIIVFSNGKTEDRADVAYTSVYEKIESDSEKCISGIFDAIYDSGNFQIADGRKYNFQQGILQSTNEGALWNILSDEIMDWLEQVEQNTWLHFSDIGKIRVGIKTTADNVFIGNDWFGDKANIELLRPLITHRNAGQIIPNNTEQWKVLYTHTIENGKRVVYDLEKYPISKEYLLSHYNQLSGRTYIQKANRKWYEIWVPQNPDSWKDKKIVFRDISEHPQFWIDDTGAIVNGDCYWIDIKNDVLDDVIYLALAIANSHFIEKYYDVKFNTKLYSGKRRYMTQYVEQFPIPYYGSELAQKAISIVKKIIAENNTNNASSDYIRLNEVVEKLFV